MGLDMYAYSVKAGILADEDQVDFSEKMFKDRMPIEGVNPNFAYWRKFNNLHGWMAKLYEKKAGQGEDFNCAYLRLMPEDIEQLEKDAKNRANLEPAAGFFWGSLDELTDDAVTGILEFAYNCREVFANGGAVVYSSWW